MIILASGIELVLTRETKSTNFNIYQWEVLLSQTRLLVNIIIIRYY